MNRGSLVRKLKIAFIFLIFFYLLFPGKNMVNAEQKEIDINSSKNPNGNLFEVVNLQPGDKISKNLTIFNEGTNNFKYTGFIGKKKSVNGLLEQLDLLIKKEDKVLFDNKLVEFSGFTPRNLASGNSETLFFQVTIPYELGNEFQGSAAEVEIYFLAEIVPDGNNDDNGDNDNDDNDDNETPGENPPDNEIPDETPPSNDSPGDDPSDEGVPGNTPTDSNTPEEKPAVEDPNLETTPLDNPFTGDESTINNESLPNDTENPDNKVINITPKITENLLPNTATNLYNYMFFGVVLLTVGLAVYIKHFIKLRRGYK